MRFDLNTLSYKYTPKSHKKDRIDVVVGDDKDDSQFHPQVKIQRWDNEVNASIRLKLPGNKDEVVSQDEKGVVFEKGSNKAILYDKPDASDEGGFEFEIHLSEKPESNKFEFEYRNKLPK